MDKFHHSGGVIEMAGPPVEVDCKNQTDKLNEIEKFQAPFKLLTRCSVLEYEQTEVVDDVKSESLIEFEGSEEQEAQLPCQNRIGLLPQDEISVDSIISALLAKIHPPITDTCKVSWNVTAKDMHNEKQAILFEEKLCISQLVDTNCKLQERNKIFLQHELNEIGHFILNIEESYDGYVVYSSSRMRKNADFYSGHRLKGIYDNKFLLICEKRKEYDYVDNVKIEKTLEARNQDDKILIAKRETKINDEGQKFKAVISIKDHDDIFVFDGGVMLLMRYLIVNNFVGDFNYYSMNLFGKVVRCVLTIHAERQEVHFFHRNFKDTILAVNTQYFNDEIQEKSETFFTRNGRIIIHYWHGYNYLLHSVKPRVKPPERHLPTLELMWRSDHILSRKYETEKKLNYNNIMEYLKNHPEVTDFIHDYINTLLKYKPSNVLEFTIKYFYNMSVKEKEQVRKKANT